MCEETTHSDEQHLGSFPNWSTKWSLVDTAPSVSFSHLPEMFSSLKNENIMAKYRANSCLDLLQN